MVPLRSAPRRPWEGGDVTREEINAVLVNLCGLHFGFESGLIGYTDSEKFYLDAEDCRRYGEAFTAAALLMSQQPATMSMEEGIEACAIVGGNAVGGDHETTPHDIIEARRVLDGRDSLFFWSVVAWNRFRSAVLTEARRLVSSGECPALKP